MTMTDGGKFVVMVCGGCGGRVPGYDCGDEITVAEEAKLLHGGCAGVLAPLEA